MFPNSLSGRFLALTIIFVMLAEVFIFVPSIARFRQDYMINRLDYIIHDKHGSYNNCTVFTDDTFYVPHKYGLFCSICSLFNPFLNCRFQYGESCLDRNNHLMKKSKFCNCLWVYRERFENEVDPKK